MKKIICVFLLILINRNSFSQTDEDRQYAKFKAAYIYAFYKYFDWSETYFSNSKEIKIEVLSKDRNSLVFEKLKKIQQQVCITEINI